MSSTVPQSNQVSQLRSRSALRRIPQVKISGTGSAVPSRIVRNEDLAALGCDSEWIIQRTGIRERRHAPPEVATSDLAIEAAQRCFDRSEVQPSDVELIIVATMSPDHWTPSTACLVQNHFGCPAAAMDLNAACSGFTYGLITAGQFVRTGAVQHALVIGADIMSRVINPSDVKTYPLFGDAAGAALLSHVAGGEAESAGPGILAYELGADGSGGDLLKVPACGSREPASTQAIEAGRHFLQMDGRPVFKWAVRMVAESLVSVMEAAHITSDDVALVILHQANIRIIDAAISDLDLPSEKVFVNLDRYGNTSAASIPLALDEAMRSGRLKPGDKVLMCGFGAGLTWASCVVQI